MSRSVALVAVALLWATAPVVAQEAAKKYAVLVGVNAYDHDKLPALKYAVADVTALGAALTAVGYDVRLLTDATAAKPTRANVDATLRDVLAAFQKGDTVVVAFAGHGLQFHGQPDAYFCPSDAKPFPDEAGTLVSVGALYRDLEKTYAGVKVLLVDACRDDPTAARGATRGVDADTAPRPPKGVAALFSCSAGERAFEHDDLKHGVFFHYVLAGLSGAAKDADGDVTFNSLAGYVAKRVATDVPARFGDGAKQSPNLKADVSGASPVLVAAAAAAAVAAAPAPAVTQPPAPRAAPGAPAFAARDLVGTWDAVSDLPAEAGVRVTIEYPFADAKRMVVMLYKGSQYEPGSWDGNELRFVRVVDKKVLVRVYTILRVSGDEMMLKAPSGDEVRWRRAAAPLPARDGNPPPSRAFGTPRPLPDPAKPKWNDRPVRYTAATLGLADAKDIRDGFTRPLGVQVGSVTPDSPAARAGVRAGDLLKIVGTWHLQTSLTLKLALEKSDTTKPLPIVVERNGARVELTVPPAN